MSGPGGRPRKPTVLKVLQGTSRKDRENPRAPKSGLMDFSKMPADLSDRERESWRRLASIIEPLRVATEADAVAFEQMVFVRSVLMEAREAIQDLGITMEVETENGVIVRKRPELEIAILYEKQLHAQLARFGLAPSERERVSTLDDTAGGNPLDEFSGGTG